MRRIMRSIMKKWKEFNDEVARMLFGIPLLDKYYVTKLAEQLQLVNCDYTEMKAVDNVYFGHGDTVVAAMRIFFRSILCAVDYIPTKSEFLDMVEKRVKNELS